MQNHEPKTAASRSVVRRPTVSRGQEPTVDVYASSVRDQGQWISCALVCPQLQAWIYIEQIDPHLPAGQARPAWSDELRKIPRARFARSESELLELARGTVAEFVERAANLSGTPVDAVLRLGEADMLSEALGVHSTVVSTSQAALEEFWLKCGAREANRAHGLLVAMGLAASDTESRYPLQLDDISRLELLLGTKNAQSMRAWLRLRATPKRQAVRRRGGDAALRAAEAV